MFKTFQEQVVVITGASAGIGAALAQEVGRRGARVVLAARRREALEQVAQRIGGRALVMPTDVTRREQVQRLASEALSKQGRIDVWINNAGRGITRGFAELTDDDVDTMVRDNIKSALYGMQAVLPHFKERKQGVLANISSMLSRIAYVPVRGAYSASKAALNALTDSLRLELARDYPEILVTTVLPGVVATDFGKNALGGGMDSRSIPGGQTAEEVARIIADGLEASRSEIYTPGNGLERVLGYLRELGTGTPARPRPS